MEEWVDIKGYEGKYQVSNMGNVRSLNYNNTTKIQQLKPKINRYGYNEVKLSKHNKTKNYLIATLVGNHFLNKSGADKEIMHIGDTSIDSVDNLRNAYRSEILYAMYKKGRRKIGEPSKYKISFEGKTYKNLNSLIREYKHNPRRVHHRIERGWTLEESLKIPFERKEKILNKRLYKYNDKLLSVKQLSKLSGISVKNIYRRLQRGWSIEETLEIPILRKKEKNETRV